MKSPASIDRAEDIRRWQVAASEADVPTASTAIISTLYNALMSFLRDVLKNSDRSKWTPLHHSSLQTYISALFFWGQDFGVSQGELDTSLQSSRHLRDTVLTVLASLGDHLILGVAQALSGPGEREALSKASNLVSLTEDARTLLDDPEEGPNYPGDQIEDFCLALQTMTESLQILGSSLECIADDGWDGEKARTGLNVLDRPAHAYYVDLINSRFPSASEQLVQELGLNNWERYQLVQSMREKTQTQLTTAEVKRAKSDFFDSGIGSSAPTLLQTAEDLGVEIQEDKPQYAATIISSRAEASHKRLPPLPEDARSGIPFECEICNKLVHITRTREWKKHVFEDICAYSCILVECKSTRPFFKDRKAMTDHLITHHNIEEDSGPKSCPLCQEDIYGGRDIICLHFARHMEEIALGVLPQSAESDSESEESSDKAALEHEDDLLSRSSQHSLVSSVPIILQLRDALNDISSSVWVIPRIEAKIGDHIYDFPDIGVAPDEFVDLSESLEKEGLLSIFRRDPELPLPGPDFPYAPQRMPTAIKCISGCAHPYDDSSTIQCNSCETWQHIHCYYGGWEEVPAVHQCNECGTLPSTRSLETVQVTRSDHINRPREDNDPAQSISKAPYISPKHPLALCPHCNERPQGFRGVHELERHIARVHTFVRKGYICVAPAFDSDFLKGCKHCSNRKVYGAYYNAAAHLRRAHFHPRKRGRKGTDDANRGGSGEDQIPMDYLRQHWIREIEIENNPQDHQCSHTDVSGGTKSIQSRDGF